MPQFFNYGYGRGEGVIVERNLLSHSHDNNGGALQTPFFLGLTGVSTVSEAWSAWFRASRFADNFVIPEVKSTALDSNYDSGEWSKTYSRSECLNYYKGFTNIVCAGTGISGETANQRRAGAGFVGGTFGTGRSGATQGYGAVLDELEKYLAIPLASALSDLSVAQPPATPFPATPLSPDTLPLPTQPPPDITLKPSTPPITDITLQPSTPPITEVTLSPSTPPPPDSTLPPAPPQAPQTQSPRPDVTAPAATQEPDRTPSPHTTPATQHDLHVPFGSFDTPTADSAVAGQVPVTGWALDDLEVAAVKIWRDPVKGEPAGRVYIGDAVFVEGARPDLEAKYPNLPFSSRAGWGYMLLSNALPNADGQPGRGNGTYRLYAIAYDRAGKSAVLGVKTIKCENAKATKPFGTLDTPELSTSVSESVYINRGWVLTPPPARLPTDRSGIMAFIDGVPVGQVTYNLYRPDVAALFPECSNTNGAGGAFALDTTTLTNGIHTIAWSATDDAGNTEGIGSRLFSVSNPGNPASLALMPPKQVSSVKQLLSTSQVEVTTIDGIYFRTGYNTGSGMQRLDAPLRISIPQMGRVEVQLQGAVDLRACQLIGSQCGALPVGSTVDTQSRTFYWQPAIGYLGVYRIRFSDRQGHAATVQIEVAPERGK
jgi:hypothetical protein